MIEISTPSSRPYNSLGPSRRRRPWRRPGLSRNLASASGRLPNQSPPRRPSGGQARPIPTFRRAGPVPMATGAGAAGALWGCRVVSCRAAPRRAAPRRTLPYPPLPSRASPRCRAPQILRRTPGGRPLHPRAQETPRPEEAAAPLPSQGDRKMKRLSVLSQQCILLMTCLLMALEAVPIDIDKTKVKGEGHIEGEKVESPDTGLYYDEYLRQVIDVLETDKHFREKLQTADIEEIKSGKLSRELDLVSHHVRTRLDELKRQEVARLRMLIKAKMDSVQDTGIDHQALLKQFEHLNHQNPDTFEPKDLDMLIKAATSDLENYDKTRHEEFKKYEMMKEHERREYLKTLDEEKRQREESKFEEMKKKHGDHPKVHHPGSKDQLKEVWEEADGLDPNEFDPKTFFKLHDVNNDGFLDEQELEALFTKELEKVYDPKNEEDDMVEMEEERLRMREHVMNEVDINKDRLVTLEEFLRATEKKEFLEPDSWETLDQQQLFTEEELKEFESHISQQEDELRKKAEDLQKQKEELQRQHDQLQAQKQELQQVVKQMEQKKLQQGNPPAGPAGELKFQPPGEHKVGDAPKHPAGGDQPLPPGHVQEPAARTDQVHP